MDNNKVFVIAEMACSHDGSLDLAKTIIDGAGVAGADAVQLQIWALQHVLAPGHEVYAVAKKIELSQDQWREMAAYSRATFSKMEIWCCVFEHKSIDFIETLGIDGYKLNSSDISNPLVLDRIAATGRKINLSVGASSLAEVQSALERLQRQTKAQITLMYGYQSFPTAAADVHLNYMAKLRDLFELPVGYQDHCDAESRSGFWLPALAVGKGATVLEKHITHDRALKGVDHQSALNPDEFVEFMQMVRDLEVAQGSGVPRDFTVDEIKYRKFQKKSIVAAVALKAGEVIREADVNFLKAADLGLAPDQTERVLGRKVKRDLAAYEVIREEDLS